MQLTRALLTALVFVCLNAPAVDTTAQTGPSAEPSPEPSSAAFTKALKEALTSGNARERLRISIEGQLAPDLTRIDIYGRGVGIWNNERQFDLDNTAVKNAVDLLLQAGFAAMPDRFAFDSSDDREKGDWEKPVRLLRLITVDVGGLSKTVTQDNKGPISGPFEKLTVYLVDLCREPSTTGVGASSLEEGLRKVAEGSLIPEALSISVNASELRSLASQTGQGWLMNLHRGTLILQSHTLKHGYRTLVDRPATADEVRALARELLDDKVYELPPNVNTQGHTQLTVGVLNHRIDVMAQTFASPKDAAATTAEQAFDAVRKALFEFYQGSAKASSATD